MTDEVAITELLEIDPDRVDAVGSPANGTEWLILKALDGEPTDATEATLEDVLSELDKAEADDAKPCPLCKGKKTIRGGNLKCPKCRGTGVAPAVGQSEKELSAIAAAKEAGVAPSGTTPTTDTTCSACNGSGQDESGQCDACAGTGKTGTAANELHTVDADGGKITVGDARESVDKSKAYSPAPYHADADETAKCGSCGKMNDDDASFCDQCGAKMKASAAYHADPDETIVCPEWDKCNDTDARFCDQCGYKLAGATNVTVAATKAMDPSLSGSVFSAANPALTDAAAQGSDPDDDNDDDSSDADAAVPGSPAWEAVDAKTATDAAMAAMTAITLLQTFCQREAVEVIAGEGSDVIHVYMAQNAICQIQSALGTIAQLAFHESIEAAKSLPDDEVVTKAGRRLAGKTITALAAARDKAKDLADHIGGVLGVDDPKKKDSGIKSAATELTEPVDLKKLAEEIENMETDELTKLLDARDEKLVGIVGTAFADAMKGKSATDNADSTANAKDANADAKGKKPTAADDDLEDEADAGYDEAGSTKTAKAEGDTKVTDTETDTESTDEPAVKAEVVLTDEEIEANEVAEKARKEHKAAKKAQKAAAEKAALTKSIEESLAKVVEQNAAFIKQNEDLSATVEKLSGELEGVKKMAAPSAIVRTRPQDALNKSTERDMLDMEISKYENLAKNTSELELRRGYADRVKTLKVQLAEVKS